MIIERLHKNSPTVSFIVDLVPDFPYPINKQEIFSYFLLRLRKKVPSCSSRLYFLVVVYKPGCATQSPTKENTWCRLFFQLHSEKKKRRRNRILTIWHINNWMPFIFLFLHLIFCVYLFFSSKVLRRRIRLAYFFSKKMLVDLLSESNQHGTKREKSRSSFE